MMETTAPLDAQVSAAAEAGRSPPQASSGGGDGGGGMALGGMGGGGAGFLGDIPPDAWLPSGMGVEGDREDTIKGEMGDESEPTSPAAGVEQDGGHDSSGGGASRATQHAPLQKRRRVTRACDECRRKKIKCDGKQPCTHCTVYSYECTYDQPSNRRRNPTPQYIEALENRLHRAEELLKTVLPDLDLSNPDLDAAVRQRLQGPERSLGTSTKQQVPPAYTSGGPPPQESHRSDTGSNWDNDNDTESLLESMVDATGQLDLDDQGHWDFYGHSSGLAFLRRMRERFGDLLGPDPSKTLSRPRITTRMFDSPKSVADSPLDTIVSYTADLPRREVAKELVSAALDDACSVMRFVHRPTFAALLDRVYDKPPDHYGDEEYKFLPLLYVVMALGCVFAKQDIDLDRSGYESALDQGFAYFKACRQMVEITDCRDLTSLQAVIFMTLFLQSSAKLTTCYSYVGIALNSALRMGLHRSVASKFNPIEREVRKRVFWTVYKMDTYVNALLGLPRTINIEDVDQESPIEIDDEYITKDSVLPMPEGKFSLYSAANAHTRILKILGKVVKYIYPIKGLQQQQQQSIPGHRRSSNVVSHATIREIERDLQDWMDSLPTQLRSGEKASPEVARAQHLLRMAYAHVQMMLYRPFLHYASQGPNSSQVDRRSYACGAACVTVSRNIIHITSEMKRRDLLIGAYWFTMYTTFFAILSLVFYCLENPDKAGISDVLKDAIEGRDTLASMARKSMAADRCTVTLANLFEHLPAHLQRGRAMSASQKKRQATSPDPRQREAPRKPSGPTGPPVDSAPSTVQRANTLPLNLQGLAQRGSVSMPAANPHQRAGSVYDWVVNQPQESSRSQQPQQPQQPRYPSQNQPQQNQTGQSFDQSFAIPAVDGNDLADFSAVMFPSANPFAYPNQPITTLEDGYSDAQPAWLRESNGYVSGGNFYQGNDQQQQQSQPQQQQPNYGSFGFPSQEDKKMSWWPGAGDGGASGAARPGQQANPGNGVPPINFDEILGPGGDEWNNMLMEQSLQQ